MKTEILDTIQVEEPFFIHWSLALENDQLILLKGKHKLGEKPVLHIEIIGTDSSVIDVSFLRGLNTGIGNTTMFAYKKGFGVIDHDHAKFYLWETSSSTPKEIKVQQLSSDNQLDLYETYLKYVSYDEILDTFVIGIGEKHSPTFYAKWHADLSLKAINGSDNIVAFWDKPILLEREDYPPTYFHYKTPVLEWLNINDLITHNGKKYIICRGGQRTVGKSGVAFEFNILSVYDAKNKMLKKFEMEIGSGRFSSDKQYFIIKPKTKKCLLVYNLETLELTYNIPLKTESNMGSIPINYSVLGDLNNELLFIKQARILNVCKLIR